MGKRYTDEASGLQLLCTRSGDGTITVDGQACHDHGTQATARLRLAPAMNIALLLEMAADGAGDRVALGSHSGGTSYAELLRLARNTAGWLASRDGQRAALLDGNSPAVPLLLFGAALAGRQFAPVSYRLASGQLRAVLGRLAPGVLVPGMNVVLPEPLPAGLTAWRREEFLAAASQPLEGGTLSQAGPDDVGVLLFTSGTSGEPKAAVLRHRQLVSYIIGNVEFLSADPDEAALVSVPPYHIAGISAILSSVYAGRRIVQLETFDPQSWVRLVNDERVTHAMVVPTMLTRIVDYLVASGEPVPSLRHLSYGGGQMPAPTIETALGLLPHIDFVNAYGLTETSSTIAVLDPADHRKFAPSEDPCERRRLGSVGRPLPSVQIEIRGPDGIPVRAGASGEVFVRGEQVAGEYIDGSCRDGDGWFATRDAGYLDEAGVPLLARAAGRCHRPRRGKSLPRRDRGRAARPPGRARRRCHRAARCRVGRAGRRRGSTRRRCCCGREGAAGLGSRPAAELEDSIAGGVRSFASLQRDRQVAAPQAAR